MEKYPHQSHRNKTIELPVKTIGYRAPTETKLQVLIIRNSPPDKFNQTPVRI